MALNIVYEDENIIVVRKSAGIATQTSKPYEKDMVSELRKHLKGALVYVVHRLDQPVEGLLVFAKDKQSAALLSKSVASKDEDDSFIKDYTAVVLSKEKLVGMRLENLIVKTKDRLAKVYNTSSRECSDAKYAVLDFEVIDEKEILVSDVIYYVTEICVHLQTGRFHQIRAQLSHASLPILGDKKYGTEESKRISDELGIRQVLLSADKLSFTHPKTKKKMEFTGNSEVIKRVLNK